MGRLNDKVVFITGTAGGQGRSAALLFAKEGAYVIGCDLKEKEAAETAEMVRAQGGKMDSSIVDLTDPDAVTRWIDGGVASAGRIDVLYNNAGNPRMSPFGEMTREDWAHTINMELNTVFYASSAAWNHLVAQGGGAIINTASVIGHRGYGATGQAAHAAAKGGVLALTRQLAAEGATHKIRVNSISPGTILTPALGVLTKEQLAEVNDMQPIGRAGQPEDIANCALYLASDEAEWVTGADFVIDGGITQILSTS
ncbi:SDR family oxidoreductase [Altericroceibacterium spongiae]|uniref:SDR family oxidoreductase n=1 Tax=Altericroceibacterium spongiae TaxID=2320269 RepID=A0A420EAI9_9SPHN|nr:SDR family NAD(P)-dependent oxidoreductase [Altericroceibacterium spongiae]RKF17670.1 SDR family oxidoreductase [Altericroceibacterium spongiae]